MTELVIVEHRGATAELTLNRPEKRNALSRAMITRLISAVRLAGADPGVRALLITGAPPAFCAGLDLDELATAAAFMPQVDLSDLAALYEAIGNCPKPVVAAVNGVATAGGAALMNACDIALLASSAEVGYPGVRRGLPATIVAPYLARHVGTQRASYLLLTGERIDARTSRDWGLASEVVEDAALLPRARKLCDQLAGYAPEGLAAMKAAARSPDRVVNTKLAVTSIARSGLAEGGGGGGSPG
jgi:enoyl-CoA hydratase/carnithine racemase